MPEGKRDPSAGSTAARGRDHLSAVPAAPAARTDEAEAAASRRVFHSPQEGQRPSHLASSWPQEEQRKTVGFFFCALMPELPPEPTKPLAFGFSPYPSVDSISIFQEFTTEHTEDTVKKDYTSKERTG